MKQKISHKIICSECKSDQVEAHALAKWSVEKQAWELSEALNLGEGTCDNCGNAYVALQSIPVEAQS